MTNTEQQKVKEASETLKEAGYLSIFWHRSDIVKASQDLGVELTEDEIDSVIEDVEDNFDAEVGVSWHTLYEAINEVLE